MRWLISIFLLAAIAPTDLYGQRPSLRVSTWDISAAKDQPVSELAEKAAQVIRRARPDVLLLQGVPDRAFCEQLIMTLRPEKYSLSVYSDFSSAPEHSPVQLAVLSRLEAFSAGKQVWWQSSSFSSHSSGFVFARYRLGEMVLNVYSTYLEKSQSPGEGSALNMQLSMAVREANSEQLLDHLEQFESDAFIIGGNFNTNPGNPLFISEGTFHTFESAGFESVFESLSDTRGIVDLYRSRFPGLEFQTFWARAVPFNGMFGIVESTVSPFSLVSCEVNVPTLAQAVPVVSGPPNQFTKPEEPEPITFTSATESVPAIAVADVPPVVPVPVAPEETEIDAPVTKDASAFLTFAWWKANPHAVLWTLGGFLIVGAAVAGLIGFRAEGRGTKREVLPARFSVNSDSNAVITCPACDVSLMVPARMFAPYPENHHHSNAGLPLPLFDACCTHGNEYSWVSRALHAERKADQAAEIVKKGLVPHVAQWMKDSFLRRVLFQRAELQQTQEVSTEQVAQLQERLSKINESLRSKLDQYEERISELEKENSAKDELNRELLKAKIIATEASRKARSMKPQNPDDEGRTKSYQFPSQDYPPST